MATRSTLYTVLESKLWRNTRTGATCSPYGAVPAWPEFERELAFVGWTVRNNDTGCTGIGRKPWTTREDAQAWADEQNAKAQRMYEFGR